MLLLNTTKIEFYAEYNENFRVYRMKYDDWRVETHNYAVESNIKSEGQRKRENEGWSVGRKESLHYICIKTS
jgi:hypothetical protein